MLNRDALGWMYEKNHRFLWHASWRRGSSQWSNSGTVLHLWPTWGGIRIC